MWFGFYFTLPPTGLASFMNTKVKYTIFQLEQTVSPQTEVINGLLWIDASSCD